MTFGHHRCAATLVACLLGAAPVVAPIMAYADGTAIPLRARGVQVYVCEQLSGAYAWRLKGPEATLLDAAGSEVGRHFAGPSWQAKDGSTVVGEALVTSRSPTEGAIPWLVLRAKSHAGGGVFASVEYIVRSQTEGGVPPAAGCDQAHLGAQSRIPYSAVYTLFQAPAQ
jgi:Protein of unknown function (DUF3455)